MFWSDEKQLEYIQDKANSLSEGISMMIKTLNSVSQNYYIPNIAIYYNNKMVELYQLFKEKKVSFSHSSVISSLDSYFTSLIIEAISCIEMFATSNQGLIPTIKFTVSGKNSATNYLEQYINICNKILNFSLQRDAHMAINSGLDDYLKSSKESGTYNGKINDSINSTNDELEMLGIGRIIEPRDDECFEISDEDLDEVEKRAWAELEQILGDVSDIKKAAQETKKNR